MTARAGRPKRLRFELFTLPGGKDPLSSVKRAFEGLAYHPHTRRLPLICHDVPDLVASRQNETEPNGVPPKDRTNGNSSAI